jgi:iron complex outermembrane receptor protein
VGGRVENNRYDPEGLRSRSFTGFSGGAGLNVPLWAGGAFVANYTHSYRAPALEELYNEGPHIGNLTFEVGNPDLVRERSNGVELALRHHSNRLRAEVSGFRYDIQDFVYLAPTGRIEEGLIEADYSQADSRFTGVEATVEGALCADVWLRLGMDYVDAQLKSMNTPLPRIPPLRGRVGIDFRRGGFSLRPELVMAAQQHQLFPTETPTAGYAVVNLGGSYTLARQHFVHVFGVQLFNAGDRLYRNHLSFIKEQAPEIGRGVRFTYTMRFF